MDMEQYEEAVRDYEKVYQTEKTKGEILHVQHLKRNDRTAKFAYFLTWLHTFFFYIA